MSSKPPLKPVSPPPSSTKPAAGPSVPVKPDAPAKAKGAPAIPGPPVPRLGSIDAFRGFVMFLMLAEMLHFGTVAKNLPDNQVVQQLAKQQSHVEWTGCTLHDLIQPSFSFIVGLALPFSLASRAALSQGTFRMILHAFWRSGVLVLLGIFLRSIGKPVTNFTFEDTLTQIGLGYTFLFILALRPMRDQWIALGLILVGYWAAFAFYPLPAEGFDVAALGIPNKWDYFTGFAAHWNKHTNIAANFDRWFLNLFPRPTPYTVNPGGYVTLSFIPTLGTMILGLIAGGILKSTRTSGSKVLWYLMAGGIAIGLGWLLAYFNVCPVVKRIWTPSWTIYSGGWCFILLAGFFMIIDWWRIGFWSFPLRVIGMNSIAAYCMDHMCLAFIGAALTRHFGNEIFTRAGEAWAPAIFGGAQLFVVWLFLFWLYRNKAFLRI
jgi:heparan-alpha-glucosaminide N-acetyltransferase